MNKPLVSVILSVYNGFPFLPFAIDSLLNQTYENIEILILNDGSDDQTAEILAYYIHLDCRIRVFTQSNLGLTKSLNRLISIASGEFILRHDADDYSHVTRISRQVEVLSLFDLDFVVCRAFLGNSNVIAPRYAHLVPCWITLLHSNPFIHGTLLIKKSALEYIGCYDESFNVSQDYDLFSRLVYSGYRFTYLSEPLYFLRRHVFSISSLNSVAQCSNSRFISRKSKCRVFGFLSRQFSSLFVS